MSENIWVWISLAIAAGLGLEAIAPLRKHPRVLPLFRRLWVNGGIALSSFWISKWTAAGPLLALSAWVEEGGFGVVPWGISRLAGKLLVPDALRFAIVMLLLDWSLYAWHRAMHEVPLLWRFHRVHHADPDMDSTTAVRFHFGEFFFSNLYRVAQVVLIGVSPLELAVFELTITFAAIYHHSNFAMPLGLERLVARIIATPRVHSIHHSIQEVQTRSNYGSLLLIWDRMHGSLRLDAFSSAGKIVLGDESWSQPRFRGLWRTLMLPFRG